jgi:hypothetical protein
MYCAKLNDAPLNGTVCRQGLTSAQILKAEATGPNVPAIMGKADERNHSRLDSICACSGCSCFSLELERSSSSWTGSALASFMVAARDVLGKEFCYRKNEGVGVAIQRSGKKNTIRQGKA